MTKKKLTCKECKYLVHIPDGNSGKRKPSCCFFHENHDTESDEVQKNCSLFEKRDKNDKFELTF
jgi:hypothetical protein